MLTPREQGDFGELSAAYWLIPPQQTLGVRVSTSGGNQSWNRVVKLLDPSRFDYLFVLVGDGRRWFIPAERIEGGCGLRLGGPKYAEFEVERGDPIPGCTVEETPSTIAS